MESPITTALINSGAGTVGVKSEVQVVNHENHSPSHLSHLPFSFPSQSYPFITHIDTLGILSYSIFYPLENFRTRLQVREHDPTLISSLSSTPSSILQYIKTKFHEIWAQILDTINFAKSVYQEHGIAGFYNGLGAGVFGIGLSNAVYMYWYQLLKDLLLKLRKLQFFYQNKSVILKGGLPAESKLRRNTLSPLDNIIVASLAGVVNISLTNPIWVINTRQMLREKSSKFADIVKESFSQPPTPTNQPSTTNTSETPQPQTSTTLSSLTRFGANTCDFFLKVWNSIVNWCKTSELWKIVHNEGFFALYKGYAASLVLVLNPTIQFVLYDQLSCWLIERKQQNNPNNPSTPTTLSNSETFILSAFCKAISTVCTFPYQVVKARQQQDEKQINKQRRSLRQSIKNAQLNAESIQNAQLQAELLQNGSSSTGRPGNTTTPTSTHHHHSSNADNDCTDTNTATKHELLDIVTKTIDVVVKDGLLLEGLYKSAQGSDGGGSGGGKLAQSQQDLLNISSDLLTQSQSLLSASSDLFKQLEDVDDIEDAMSLYQTMVQMYKNEGSEVFFRGLVPKLIQTVSNTALSTVLHERIKEYLMELFVQREF